MRGKVHKTQAYDLYNRITPAYAGKSMSQMAYTSMCQDHPRLCGEKVDFHEFIFHKLGSPPPMRGKVFIFYSKERR